MTKANKADFQPPIRSVKKRIKEAKKKGRKIKFNLTEAHLQKVWKKQHGICPCCGIEMDLIGKTHERSITPDMRATVDRIVPKDGYVKGNVQLMHAVCNRFKGQMPGSWVYAVARRIVEQFEGLYPGTKVDIDRQLKAKDERAYLYPRYAFTPTVQPGLTLGGSAEAHARPSPPKEPEANHKAK